MIGFIRKNFKITKSINKFEFSIFIHRCGFYINIIFYLKIYHFNNF